LKKAKGVFVHMNHRGLLLAVIICLIALTPQSAEAKPLQARVSPPVQPGFPLLLDSSFVFLSGLNAADLNGDGQKEIIFGVRELDSRAVAFGGFGCRGVVYAVKPDGTLLWRTLVRADVDSTPAVVDDLNGDGSPDVVVGMGAFEVPPWENENTECGKGDPELPGNGGVVALSGQTGAILWVFNTADKGEWGAPNNGVLDGVWSAPATGDIRRDIPGPETVVGAWDNCVYLLDKSGNAIWGVVPFPYNTYPTLQGQCNNHGFLSHDTVWSSPALADIDGDGALDIIIGGDSTAPNWYGMPDGGVVWVISGNGQIIARKWFDQSIYSSPAVADVDGDGKVEILVGSGDAYKNPAGNQYLGHYVTALNFDSAQADPTQRLVTKWQAQTNGPVRSSPAIGDLNLDGILDVVAISKYDNNGSFTVGSPGKPVDGSYIYAWDGATGAALRGFPVHACNSLGQAFPINGSPIMADIAGDNHPEILFQNAREVGIVNWDGSFYTRINDVLTCTPAPASQTNLVYGRLDAQNGAITTTPVVADLDGDGDLEVAVVARYNEDDPSNNIRGEVWVWANHKSGRLPWPMLRQNPRHTAVFPGAPQLSLQPDPLTILYQFGGAGVGVGSIKLTNRGASSFDWTSTALAGITVTPDVGSLAEGQSQVLQVEISAVGLDRGVYPGGWVEVTAQTELSANPVVHRADVTLIVADISKLYLPTILMR
jgi:hypothetical protein